jgi:hypothetical protein
MVPKVQVGPGSVINLATRIRIRNSVLWILGSGSERNIYGSTTLVRYFRSVSDPEGILIVSAFEKQRGNNKGRHFVH